MLSYYNASTDVTWAMGDFNGDGSVNGTDLNTVLSSYNKSHGRSSLHGGGSRNRQRCLLTLVGVASLLVPVWRNRK